MTSQSIGFGDLAIRRVGYGAMALTGPGGWGKLSNPAAGAAVLRRAAALGVQLIDTADSYGPNVSEELVAETLHPYPEGMVIGTKGGFIREGPWQLRADGRPEHLRAACEGSLRRLRLDCIDLYFLHTVDRAVPFEDSVGALAELQAEGKIRHIGLSNVGVGQLEAARRIVPVVAVQNHYNLVERSPAEEAVLEHCRRDGLAYLPWQPLSKGLLAKEHSTIGNVAQRVGASPAQVALAWLLARSPAMLPIPGTCSVEHLEENVAALDLQLSAEDLAGLDRYRPPTWDARTIAKRFAPAPVKRVAGRLLASRRR